jgi:hypothetical protein
MLIKVFSSPLVRVAFRYGAVSGFLVMIFVVSMFYMGGHPFLINLFLDPRIPVLGVMIFVGLRELRDYSQGGTLFFAQGMVTSFLLTIVCAALCWTALLAFASYDNRFVTEFISQATEQTRAFSPEDIQRIGQDRFNQSLEELQKVDKYFLAGRYFVQTFIISFFVSVIVTVIVRKTNE